MKIILLCASLLLAVVSQAQAVFEIKSPPSISGYYTISLGDSTVHYWGNGSIAKKSITAELMLATGADSLASATLKGDFSGKIAVIFRGAVSFASKAMKAQAAGAVAVVIVNHGIQADGSVNGDEVFTMAGGTSYSAGDGAFVTIPVVMISKNSYLKMSQVLRSAETVEGYIGGKQSLDYDLKLSSDLLIVPTKSTRTKSMVRQGMVSDTLGFSLINNGDKDQYNIGVRALIVRGLDTLYNRGVIIDTIVAKDTIGYYFFADQSGVLPFRPTDDLDTGRYDLTYSVVNLNEVTFNDTLIDQYDQDNVVKTSFYVTDSVYAIAKMSSYKASNGKTFHNVPVWGTATRPGSTYTNYSSCIVYKDENGENLEASSMTFMAYMTSGVLKDNLFKVNVYEWNDPFVDIRDSLFAFNDLNPLVDNQEYISKDSLVWDYQKVVFDNPVKLNLGQRYLFCVTTSNPNVMFGFDDDAPSLRGSTVYVNREPLFAIAIDGKYYAAGWSPGYKFIPTISVNVSEPSCISASILSTDEKGFESKDGTAEIIIESGSNNLTYTWDDANNSKTKKVENLAPGTYSVTISNGSCSIVKKVTIKKYQCKLVSEMNKVDETSNSGNNGKASVVVTGGTQPYNYSWSTIPVQTDSLAINLTPGKYFVTVKDKSGCYITDSVEISKYICKLTVSTTKSDESGFNLNDGNATVSPKGGSRPYTYVWNSNPTQTDSLASKLTPGKYYVTVKDAAGCSAKDSVEISKYICKLIVSTTKSDESGFNLNDGNATVSPIGGSRPYTYVWNSNPTQTDSLASNLTPGKYYVTVKDAAGCSAKDSVEIKMFICDLSISTESTEESGVNKKDATAKVNVIGGQAPFNYIWNTNPVQTTPDVKNLTAGVVQVIVSDKNGCRDTAEVKIIAKGCTIKVTTKSYNESRFNAKNGAIKATVTGANGTLDYSWSNLAAKTDSISKLAPGTYKVTVKDVNGCVAEDIAKVDKYICNLSVSVSSVNETGFGKKDGKAEVKVLSGKSPYTYSWNTSPVKTTALVSGLSSGKYIVSVKDVADCIVKDTVEISKFICDFSITTKSTEESGSNKKDATATVSLIGGKNPFIYIWNTNPVQTTQVAKNLTAGTFTVIVTDANGCKDTADVNITTKGCNIKVSTKSYNESNFNAKDGSIKATVTGAVGKVVYTWSNLSASTDSVFNLAPGTYSVSVKDDNGCTAVSIADIKPIICSLSLTTSFTEESGPSKKDATAKVNVFGGQAPFSYTWSTNPVQTTNEAKDLTAGVVRVVVLDKNGCRDSADVKIVTKGCKISVSTKSYNETKYNAKDGAIKAIVSGANGTIDYSWSNLTATTDSVSKLAPGSYKVTVKDVNGCVAEENAKINAYVCKLSINVTGTSESSLGKKDGKAEVKILSGKSPYTYSWNTTPVKTTAIASGISSGKYIVTVKDAAGCIKLDSIVIAPIVCNLKIDSTKIKDESATNKKDGTVELFISGQNSSYKVYNGTTQVNSNKATGLTKGSYKFKVIDAKGCEATTDVMIGNLSISKQNVLNVALFPNPMSEQLNVSFVTNNNVSLILSGISGNVIETKNVSGIVKTSFNTSSLSSGVYLITIKDNESSYSYKVVKE